MGQRDPRVDDYIARSAGFAQPILGSLREQVHAACPDCEETLKWGAPSFTWRGRILCGMAAFKQHATFGFWQGSAIVGTDGRQGEAMGQFGRLTRVGDLPGRREFAGYVRAAMQRIEDGATRPKARAAKPPLEIPAELAAALQGDPVVLAVFEAFPPGARREYAEWIAEARREDTRARRVADAVAWIAQGKRRNWKYEKC